MNDEKFVQLFGGIDEKYICEANGYMNSWLESQVGEVVRAEYSRRSPWKTVIASVAGIAAAFGFFALVMISIARFGNLNGNVYPDGNASMDSSLDDYKIENLDYENAVIIENTPVSGQWKRLSYAISGINGQSPDRMARIAEAYGVTINKDEIQARMLNSSTNPGLDSYKQFSEAYETGYDEMQFTQNDKVPYNGVFYQSEELYIEINAPGFGWIEIENRKNVNSILGIDWHETGAWQPSLSGAYENLSKPEDEERIAVLNGKTVKVADAVRNAQKYVSENDALFPQTFNAEVKDIGLYSYENGNQSVDIRFQYFCDGVEFVAVPSLELVDFFYSQGYALNSFTCTMLTEDTVDLINFNLFDGTTEFAAENCEATVSRENALKLVSRGLDTDKTLPVREIKLVYAERRTDGGKTSVIEPTWLITIAKEEDASEIYGYVSAVDGAMWLYGNE